MHVPGQVKDEPLKHDVVDRRQPLDEMVESLLPVFKVGQVCRAWACVIVTLDISMYQQVYSDCSICNEGTSLLLVNSNSA